jgi:hypothetical protein
LQNSGGTPQLQWGAGGGNNLSVDVAININPANAAVSISPTGTGTVAISPAGALTVNPTAASTINNTSIGATTASTGRFTSVTATTGNIVIGTSGQGIDFSATSGTGTSELLADYEEGTWTPVLGGTTGASGQTYSTQQGFYTKVGRQVTCTFSATVTTVGTLSGSEACILGLPFASAVFSSGNFGYLVSVGANMTCASISVENGLTRTYLMGNTSDGVSPVTYRAASMWVNNSSCWGSITYFV